MQVMDKINRRYGNGTIHTGAENSEAWKPQQASLSSLHDGVEKDYRCLIFKVFVF
jgi:hypothetical protein